MKSLCLVVALGVFVPNVLCQNTYCNKWEEVELQIDGGVQSYDCNTAEDGDLLSYRVEPADNHEDDRFQVLHYVGAECEDRNPEYIVDDSCDVLNGVPYCSLHDSEIIQPALNSTKSCIDVICESTGGCELIVFIQYTPSNFKPLEPNSIICSSTEQDKVLAHDAWRTLYCSDNYGLSTKAKLDYYVQNSDIGVNSSFSTFYTTGDLCNWFPEQLGSQNYVAANSCATPTDDCEKSNIKITKNNIGSCLIIACQNDRDDCVLDWNVQFYIDPVFQKQIRFQVDEAYLRVDDYGIQWVVTEREHGLDSGDRFEMDIKMAAGASDDDFVVYHGEGDDCNYLLTRSRAISFSSCRDETERCTKTDTVGFGVEQECVRIVCENFLFDCELDVFIEWASGSPGQGSLVVMLIASIMVAFNLL